VTQGIVVVLPFFEDAAQHHPIIFPVGPSG
jgi:hypothetical protein